ncbi:MAG: hypothetical protein RIQ81_1346 [Pseudomonadota bacterium]
MNLMSETSNLNSQAVAAAPGSNGRERLAGLGVNFPVMVAPMVGISHVAFRAMVRRYVPCGLNPLVFTEMLSTRRLPSERLDTTAELRCTDGERAGAEAFIPQLLGNEERFIAPSVAKLETLGPWGFDINMGCPATHVLKHNWGVRLMGDPAYAADVVRMVRSATQRPVSVKMRGGGEKVCELAHLDEFTHALQEAGADWITIHARARDQGHEGRADWELVAEIARRRKIAVVANGDIQTAGDVLALLRSERPVDGVMVARAATVRPWILWQVAEDLGIDAKPPGRAGEFAPRSELEESAEFFRACLFLIDDLDFYLGDRPDDALKKFSFFAATGARWFMFGHAFWAMTRKAKSIDHLRSLVLDYRARFAHPLKQRIQ